MVFLIKISFLILLIAFLMIGVLLSVILLSI
jgi:hypothetical protein